MPCFVTKCFRRLRRVFCFISDRICHTLSPQALLQGVQQHGKCWAQVAKNIPGRNQTKIRDRCVDTTFGSRRQICSYIFWNSCRWRSLSRMYERLRDKYRSKAKSMPSGTPALEPGSHLAIIEAYTNLEAAQAFGKTKPGDSSKQAKEVAELQRLVIEEQQRRKQWKQRQYTHQAEHQAKETRKKKDPPRPRGQHSNNNNPRHSCVGITTIGIGKMLRRPSSNLAPPAHGHSQLVETNVLTPPPQCPASKHHCPAACPPRMPAGHIEHVLALQGLLLKENAKSNAEQVAQLQRLVMEQQEQRRTQWNLTRELQQQHDQLKKQFQKQKQPRGLHLLTPHLTASVAQDNSTSLLQRLCPGAQGRCEASAPSLQLHQATPSASASATPSRPAHCTHFFAVPAPSPSPSPEQAPLGRLQSPTAAPEPGTCPLRRLPNMNMTCPVTAHNTHSTVKHEKPAVPDSIVGALQLLAATSASKE